GGSDCARIRSIRTRRHEYASHSHAPVKARTHTNVHPVVLRFPIRKGDWNEGRAMPRCHNEPIVTAGGQTNHFVDRRAVSSVTTIGRIPILCLRWCKSQQRPREQNRKHQSLHDQLRAKYLETIRFSICTTMSKKISHTCEISHR